MKTEVPLLGIEGAARPRRARVRRRAPARAVAVAAVVALQLAMPGAVRAELPSAEGPATPAELALLPEYCDYVQAARHAGVDAAKWTARLGETFWALHHYCWGILKFNRSQILAYPKIIRSGLQTSALGEFAFVIRTMPEDYVLAPEIFTYVGRTHLLLDHPADADAAFATARKAKPDYWPAYSWWATYLANHGQKEQARAIVTEGLRHSPDSKTLQLIAKDLDAGGKPQGKKAN